MFARKVRGTLRQEAVIGALHGLSVLGGIGMAAGFYLLVYANTDYDTVFAPLVVELPPFGVACMTLIGPGLLIAGMGVSAHLRDKIHGKVN